MAIPWEFIIGFLTLVLTFVGTILAVSSHLGKRIDAGNRHTEKHTEKLIKHSDRHTEKLIDITNQRITETNQRITDLSQRMDNHFGETNQRTTDAGKNTEKQIESSKQHTDKQHTDKLIESVQQHTAVLFEIVTQLVNSNSQHSDETNQRIDRLTNDMQEVKATLFGDDIIGESDTIQESEESI